MEKVRKILIIDDDATTAFLHKRLLSGMQVAEEVEYMTDPNQALEYILSNHSNSGTGCVPELIFLDVEMPEMNGFQFMDKLESGGISMIEDVFIVMHTASLLPDYKEKAETLYKERVKGFVQKPLQEAYVKEDIRRVKDRKPKRQPRWEKERV